MQIDWEPVRRELAACRAAGVDVPLWWRDDDATECSAALDRLHALAGRTGVPVHLAVIPEPASPQLAAFCAGAPDCIPLVHGRAHRNHAPAGRKKAEFNDPRPGLVTDAAAGLSRMRALFGQDVQAVFVPPWNRICAEAVTALPTLGYRGLSTFTPRAARMAAPGLVAVNTHLDPINWRGGGGLTDVAALVARTADTLKERREGRADRAEPLGLLTHHLVHDERIWAFTEAWLETLCAGGARPTDLRGPLP